MDEKGVQLGQGGKVLAIVDWELKTVHQIKEGSWEMVTVIESVCADGLALDPIVIFFSNGMTCHVLKITNVALGE
jgi:hypothetical protein